MTDVDWVRVERDAALQRADYFAEACLSQKAEIERLRQAVREAIELSDTGSDRHRAAFDPHGAGEIPAGWRVVEKIRETLIDGGGAG